MSLNLFNEGECVLTSQKHCPCIEFVLGPNQRHGFHASQLLHYRLEHNEPEEKDSPPERLTIAFATADVTLTGWHLDKLSDHLRDGDLLAVRVVPSRYSKLQPNKTSVTFISVEPVRTHSTEPGATLSMPEI